MIKVKIRVPVTDYRNLNWSISCHRISAEPASCYKYRPAPFNYITVTNLFPYAYIFLKNYFNQLYIKFMNLDPAKKRVRYSENYT